jgi:hypothetical protein
MFPPGDNLNACRNFRIVLPAARAMPRARTCLQPTHTMEPTKISLVKSPGMLALGAFLVVFGLSVFIHISFLAYIVGILGIAAGALILIGK